MPNWIGEEGRRSFPALTGFDSSTAREGFPIVSSTPARRLPVSIMDLRELRLLVERSSRAVHSNANMVRQDKVIVLGHLAKAKRIIDSALQLELFSDDQLLG